MATNGSANSGSYQGRYVHFEWSTVNTNPSTNIRTIHYKFTALGGNSSNYYHHNNVFKINGTIVYQGGSSDYIKTGTILKEGNFDINQDNFNKLTVNMNGGIYSYGDNINTTAEWNLDAIDRYANLTSLTVKSRTINTITLSFTTDRNAWIFINLNNGQDYLNNGEPFASNVTSGEITIQFKDRASTQRLDPNTTYTITVLCRALNRNSELDTKKNISVATLDIAKLVSVPNVNIGSKQTITWSNPSGATTSLKLCKTDNTQIANIGTVTGTSKDYTATASTIYALTPNSNTYKARYILTTTQNGQSYTNSKDFNFIVTNSNPTFSNFTYKDINTKTFALTNNNQKMINGYSNIQATVSPANKAVAKNSATMKSYILAIGAKATNPIAYNSEKDVNLTINAINSSTLKLSATDSRGNSTTVTKTIASSNYLQYTKPVVKSIIAERGTGGIGTEVNLTYNGTFWNSSFGKVSNALASVKYYYRVAGSGAAWTTGATALSPTISGNNFSQSIVIQGDLAGSGFDRDKNFEIKIVVTDKLDSGENTFIFSSGIPLVAKHKNGIAIKQKYDPSLGGVLQLGGSANVKDVMLRGYLGQIAGVITGTTTDNFNTALREGEWQINGGGNITGGPHTGNLFGKLIVKVNNGTTHNNSNNWIWQYFLETSGIVYFRNKTNAGAWSSWSIIRRGNITGWKSLYYNATGTTGSITLNETAANFSYIEIYYYKANCGYGSAKIYSPNGKDVNLMLNQLSEKIIFQNLSKRIKISGTSITVDTNASGYGNVSASKVEVNTENNIHIFCVVGYY